MLNNEKSFHVVGSTHAELVQFPKFNYIECVLKLEQVPLRLILCDISYECFGGYVYY